MVEKFASIQRKSMYTLLKTIDKKTSQHLFLDLCVWLVDHSQPIPDDLQSTANILFAESFIKKRFPSAPGGRPKGSGRINPLGVYLLYKDNLDQIRKDIGPKRGDKTRAILATSEQIPLAKSAVEAAIRPYNEDWKELELKLPSGQSYFYRISPKQSKAKEGTLLGKLKLPKAMPMTRDQEDLSAGATEQLKALQKKALASK